MSETIEFPRMAPCPICAKHFGHAEWDEHFRTQHPTTPVIPDWTVVVNWYYGDLAGLTLDQIAEKHGWEHGFGTGESEAPDAPAVVPGVTNAARPDLDALERRVANWQRMGWGPFNVAPILDAFAELIEAARRSDLVITQQNGHLETLLDAAETSDTRIAQLESALAAAERRVARQVTDSDVTRAEQVYGLHSIRKMRRALEDFVRRGEITKCPECGAAMPCDNAVCLTRAASPVQQTEDTPTDRPAGRRSQATE